MDGSMRAEIRWTVPTAFDRLMNSNIELIQSMPSPLFLLLLP